MKSCEVAIRRFSEQYKNIPGVLGIEKDGFFSDSILVFIDSNKFKKNSLPDKFEDEFKISLYDVRYILSTSCRFLEIAKKENVDMSAPQHRSTFEYFIRAVEVCMEMLLWDK